MSGRVELVVFDLDGVLVDSAPGIHHSLDVALRAASLPEATHAEALAVMGPPLRSGLLELLSARGTPADVIERLVEELVPRYRSDYVTTSLERTLLHDGVLDVLAELREGGLEVALATSKPRPATEPLLERFGLTRFLRPIGCPLDVAHDTKTDVLRRVLGECGVDAGRAVMVGDRHHDIGAALELGAWAVGVTWGYGSREELMTAGAHVLAERPADVLRIVEELPCAC